MALVLADRVKETGSVSGTGDVSLGGAVVGYQTFDSGIGNNNITYYTIASPSGSQWEVGYGTYTSSGNTLSRDVIYSSSAAGAKVSFTAGTYDVFCTYPAEQAIFQELNGDLKLVGGVIGLTVDGTTGTTLPNTSFQAFTTGNYYMQANQQNLDSGNAASADWVVTADNGTDTENYMDMGMASSGYNYPAFSATHPNTGYIQSTGSELALVSGKYGANVAAANASSTDIVFTAGDLLVSGERARIKGSSGNVILSNTPNPSDTGSKLQVVGNASITGNVAITGAAFSNAVISSDNQLATKSYVDTAVSTGLHIHQPVQLAQSANLTATYLNGASGVGANLTNSGTQVALVVDTITANVSDRILVYGQSNAVQNGVYVVSNTGSNSTNWVLTRSSDADTYAPQSDTGLGGGDYFYVQSGATQAGDSYVCTNDGVIVFGTTDITFTQFSGAITYVGSSPINVTGQTISLGGIVDEAHGGTGLSTYSTGDIVYANAGNSLSNLTVGSTDQTLVVSGGVPTWGALNLAGVGVSGALNESHGGTNLTSYTLGDIIYSNATNRVATLAGNTLTTRKFLSQTGSGAISAAPSWQQPSTADITGLGTMATQNATSVAITGGSVNGTLIGNATASSGAFTTLSASSTVSGTGFSNYLNSPPSIGGVAPNTGAFTTLAGTTLGLTNVFTSTYAGSATTGLAQVYLNGATSNRIDFNQNGVNPPAVTTRSTGTKVVYFSSLSASATDYATGIEGNTLWNSVPGTTQAFKWYANVTAIATLAGTGVLSTTGGFSGNGANLTALSASSITTGGLNNIPVGNTTASTGAFTTLNASGLANFAGQLYVGTTVSTGGAAIEIGQGRTGEGFSYIDMHSAVGADYETRIIRGGGANGVFSLINTGFGDYQITQNNAAAITFNTSSVERMRLAGDGNLSVDTNTLFVDATNNRVGVGTTAPQYNLSVAGASNGSVVLQVYNANTNSITQSIFQLNVGGTKYTNFAANYGSSYLINQGIGLTTYYEDYDTHAFRNNAGANQFVVGQAASAVNYVQVTGAVTGSGPTMVATGTDTNIDLRLTPKGTGYANITSGGIKFPDGTTQTTAASAGISASGNSSIGVLNVNITANATIAAGTNGFSVGPVNTANNVTVTIASGQRWVII